MVDSFTCPICGEELEILFTTIIFHITGHYIEVYEALASLLEEHANLLDRIENLEEAIQTVL